MTDSPQPPSSNPPIIEPSQDNKMTSLEKMLSLALVGTIAVLLPISYKTGKLHIDIEVYNLGREQGALEESERIKSLFELHRALAPSQYGSPQDPNSTRPIPLTRPSNPDIRYL